MENRLLKLLDGLYVQQAGAVWMQRGRIKKVQVKISNRTSITASLRWKSLNLSVLYYRIIFLQFTKALLSLFHAVISVI